MSEDKGPKLAKLEGTVQSAILEDEAEQLPSPGKSSQAGIKKQSSVRSSQRRLPDIRHSKQAPLVPDLPRPTRGGPRVKEILYQEQPSMRNISPEVTPMPQQDENVSPQPLRLTSRKSNAEPLGNITRQNSNAKVVAPEIFNPFSTKNSFREEMKRSNTESTVGFKISP
jgi:hypothetical protein